MHSTITCAVRSALALSFLFMLLAGGGCNRQPGERAAADEPRATASGLELPAGCRLARMSEELGAPALEFQRFDGQYPEHWPAGFTLPDPYYLYGGGLALADAKNAETQDLGYRRIEFGGLAQLSFEQAAEYFRKQGQAAGFVLASDSYSDTEEVIERSNVSTEEARERLRLTAGPGYQQLQLRQDPPGGTPGILVSVYSDDDMGGYTFIKGHITVYLGAPTPEAAEDADSAEDADAAEDAAADGADGREPEPDADGDATADGDSAEGGDEAGDHNASSGSEPPPAG